MEATITLIDFLAIPIVATGMSIAINAMKGAMPEVSPKFLTVLMSLLVGAAYYYVSDTSFFVSFLGILSAASTVYGLFLKEQSSEAI